MTKSQTLSLLKATGKSALVILTVFLIHIYSIAFIEKIERPNFKNLTTIEFIIIGIILLILIFINLKWVFGFFKPKK